MKELVYLGLGSNLGDRLSHIEKAVASLEPFVSDMEQAPVYLTAPRDYLEQDDFLNTAVRGLCGLSPLELLEQIHSIEAAGGRNRESGIEKGPRTIDIDILLFGNRAGTWRTEDGESLCIPHRSIGERLFVLKPILDLDPLLRSPVDGTLWADQASHLVDQKVMLYRT